MPNADRKHERHFKSRVQAWVRNSKWQIIWQLGKEEERSNKHPACIKYRISIAE
jgi:hypothetical protein